MGEYMKEGGVDEWQIGWMMKGQQKGCVYGWMDRREGGSIDGQMGSGLMENE